MAQPMRRPGLRRHEAARELVLALRASLEDADAALDAELERLVVARLEMQKRNVWGAAPVAAVQHHLRKDVQCAREELAVELDQHHQDMLGERLAEAPEELEIEVGGGVMSAVGAVVAPREEAPVLVPDVPADEAMQAHPGLLNPAPLLPD